MDIDSARIASIEATVSGISATLSRLERAVQGEIDAGNVGLVRRVSTVEKRIETELEKAAEVHKTIIDHNAKAHREIEQSIVGLKVKMAGYGFFGSGIGGALLIAVLRASNNLGGTP